MVIGFLTICLASWYVLAGFGYSLNSGQLGRDPYLFPFQCFAEALPCYWFGGKEHRTQFIKKRIGISCQGWMISSKRPYSYDEIRKDNLYEEVFWAMCGGRFSFWFGHFFGFFFGPIFLLGVMILMVVLLPIFIFRYLISRFKTNKTAR
jgi:hypothetical protein